jgi:hypothetical protein
MSVDPSGQTVAVVRSLPYEVIKHIYENKELLQDIIIRNQFPELNILYESTPEKLCYEAAKKGYLHLLRVAHENGCPWDERVCTIAAWHGNLDCLVYADKHGCPMDEWIYIDTWKGGHRECFKYVAMCCGYRHELNDKREVVEY